MVLWPIRARVLFELFYKILWYMLHGVLTVYTLDSEVKSIWWQTAIYLQYRPCLGILSWSPGLDHCWLLCPGTYGLVCLYSRQAFLHPVGTESYQRLLTNDIAWDRNLVTQNIPALTNYVWCKSRKTWFLDVSYNLEIDWMHLRGC